MDDVTRASLDLLLGEYKELKAEQRDRMGHRDGMAPAAISAQVLAVAAIAAGKAGPELLLVLPPIAFALGWLRLATADKVSEIRRYIRGSLRLEAIELVGPESGWVPFGWETRESPRRVSRKFGQLISDLVVFVGGPLAAVVTELALPGTPPLMGIPGGLGAILSVFLASEIIRRSDLHATPR